MSGEADLLLAEQRMLEDRARLARQRALVDELRRKGHDLRLASELLDAFEQALMDARERLEAMRHRRTKDLAGEKKARATV